METVTKALIELGAARFVDVDDTTAELLIRTMVKHDPPRNANIAKGMWAQWESVQSDVLKQVIIEHIPAEVWLRNPTAIPDAARTMRATG